jgi:phospholipid/cholesterol/gamma-HCH transport system ATP-binding protein
LASANEALAVTASGPVLACLDGVPSLCVQPPAGPLGIWATPDPATAQAAAAAVVFSHVSLAFDDHVVLRDLSFTIPKGGMRFLLGASGSGKTVVLKLILGLLQPDAGTIWVNGQRIDRLREDELLELREDIGMVFQDNALFDSLTVAENAGYQLTEQGVDREVVRARVEEVLGFVGLGDLADRLPAQLSGGQRRRVAIARAIASDPDLLLFDDPMTGLDPMIAMSVDHEIIKLRDLRDVTSIVVSNQMRDAFYIATHEAVQDADRIRIQHASESTVAQIGFMVLHDGRLHFEGTATELLASTDPYLKRFMLKTLPPW